MYIIYSDHLPLPTIKSCPNSCCVPASTSKHLIYFHLLSLLFPLLMMLLFIVVIIDIKICYYCLRGRSDRSPWTPGNNFTENVSKLFSLIITLRISIWTLLSCENSYKLSIHSYISRWSSKAPSSLQGIPFTCQTILTWSRKLSMAQKLITEYLLNDSN